MTAEEKPAIDLARGFMLGEVAASAMRQLRALEKPWLRMLEKDQKEVIVEVLDDCRQAINKAVELIATDARTCFVAQLDSVTFKDGVKAVLQMPNTPASHELADTAGGSVYVVIEDPRRYLHHSSATPTADPDQASI